MPPRPRASRPFRIGVITDEHIGLTSDRKGGFGWATEQLGRLFRARPELGVELTILHCQRLHAGAPRPAEIEGVSLRWRQDGRLGRFPLNGPRLDLLLCIDYRPNYRIALLQWPLTPVVLWVRDPWDRHSHAALETLRTPGHPDTPPPGVSPPDHRSFRQIWRWSRWLRRPLVFGTTAAFLRARVPDAYDIPAPDIALLPNPLSFATDDIPRAERPTVLFLGRLDPVKRPWLFVELARSFPDAEFLMAGQNHFTGRGSWQPENLPPNLRLLGHVAGAAKREALGRSWLLVNTSIHEGLPVSAQEALACGLPMVSTLDCDGIASRFGVFVGEFPGEGWDALPPLRTAVGRLLADHAERERLSAAGRRWARETHNPDAFLAAFRTLAARAGRPLPA